MNRKTIIGPDRPSRARIGGFLGLLLIMLFSVALTPAYGQQFNSDNYWTAPHGVGTFIMTAGQHYSTLLDTVALFPNWEFTLGATLFNEDRSTNTTKHYSSTAYAKYMFYENETKDGGWAIMAGTGLNPGYLQSGTVTNDLRSYWAYVPVTIPFLKGAVSWDIMPGATLNREYGAEKKDAWGFLYSTRVAVYKIIPSTAIVGEIFGTEGDAYSQPQYKVGLRYETPSVVAAISYGATLNSNQGAGIEFGIMVFTPPFLCFGKC